MAVVKKKKSFSRKYLGKTKYTLRKIPELGLGIKIRCGIYALILFFFSIVIFNLEPDSNIALEINNKERNTQELVYLFHDQEGSIYMINKAPDGEHGAPQTWEYLFEGVEGFEELEQEVIQEMLEEESEVNTSEVDVSKDDTTEEVINTGTFVEVEVDTEALAEQPEKTDVEETTEEVKEEVKEEETTGFEEQKERPVGQSFSLAGKMVLVDWENLGLIWEYFEQEKALAAGIHLLPKYNNCMTPWGYTVTHGESFLAYKQDLNTPDSCHIQRRVCFDGDLSGTFTQESCQTNDKYSYYQEQFVAYNQVGYNRTSLGELIQPSKDLSQTPETIRDNDISDILSIPNAISTILGGNSNALSPEEEEVEQTERPTPSCITPWGETVKHGQFVKAYKHKNGFNDAPCKVQIRTCVLGGLEGTFQNYTCKNWDTSYIDWINGSPTWDTYSQEKLKWVRAIINDEKNYDKEYGNGLESSALDQILWILDQ